MRKRKNLTGQIFSKLIVIEFDEEKYKEKGRTYWKCRCECGNIVSVQTSNLLNSNTKSCGCLQKEKVSQVKLCDLTGQTFGELTVIKREFIPNKKGTYWMCECKCGNNTVVREDHLKNGTTISCGCIKSKGELLITQILIENNIDFKTQYSFSDLKGESLPLRFDFAIFKNEQLYCLIEFQGEQHEKPITFFGGDETFQMMRKYDNKKEEYCKTNEIKLVKIYYQDIDKLSTMYLKEMGAI